MSKNAEQAGLVAYPVNNVKVHKGYNGEFVDYDKNKEKREIFVQGFEKAEEEFMAKAEKFYRENLLSLHSENFREGVIEDFKKAMQE